MDPGCDDEDARTTELETLEAIFPELRRLDARGFTFELELPVAPVAPVTVLFPSAAPTICQGARANRTPAAAGGEGDSSNGGGDGGGDMEDSLRVAHLPPLLCRIVLPDGYPLTCAPQVKISTMPQWLSSETLTHLEEEAPRLWEEMGRDLIAYTYIDHVQRAADDVFGAISPEGTLEVDPAHKLAVLDYDIKAKRAAFEKETFDCGVCLDPKKGSKCHKMLDCDHIFCLQCLQDFYNDAIQAGNLSTIRCLAPNCAKKRADAAKAASTSKSARRPKTFISPSELLQVGLTEEAVRRYVNLKYKTELESDKNTVYCPRQWCNGAARSKKHKKPSGLDFTEISDTDSDTGEDVAGNDKEKPKQAKKFNTADLLCVCEDCGLAFCSRCFQSWHGEFFHCAPRRENGELTEEDKASLDYLKLHTSPCPTCNAPAQKTYGCNHMICSRCDSHFCYLCSVWLDPGNPYQHFNSQPNGKFTSCYMRLWELEGGDGDDVGLGFEGGDRGRGVAAAGVDRLDAGRDGPDDFLDFAEIEIEEVVEQDVEDRGNVVQQGVLPQNDRHIAVAREAPLVLRLMDNNQQQNQRNQGRADGGGGAAANQQPRQAARPRAAGARGARGRGGHGHGLHHAGPPQQVGGARGRAGARAAGPRRGGRAAAAAAGGGAGGPAARGGRLAGRQNQHHNQDNDGHRNAGDQARVAEAAAAAAAAAAPNHGGEGLDALQEAWVRHFVQMALVDAEDEIEDGESDDEHGVFAIH